MMTRMLTQAVTRFQVQPIHENARWAGCQAFVEAGGEYHAHVLRKNGAKLTHERAQALALYRGGW